MTEGVVELWSCGAGEPESWEDGMGTGTGNGNGERERGTGTVNGNGNGVPGYRLIQLDSSL